LYITLFTQVPSMAVGAKAAKRICAELKLMENNPVEGVRVTPTDDMFTWHAEIMGPEDSAYHGGVFELLINFPEDYPFVPLRVQFVTKVYHCNINEDGQICLDILKADSDRGGKWSPSLRVGTVMQSIRSLLTDPNPDSPLRSEIAVLFKHSRPAHDENVRRWIATHAAPRTAVEPVVGLGSHSSFNASGIAIPDGGTAVMEELVPPNRMLASSDVAPSETSSRSVSPETSPLLSSSWCRDVADIAVTVMPALETDA